MISKERKEAFRARELDDSSKIKNAPIAKIDAYLESEGFDPPVKLWEHQRRAVALGLRHKSYLFLLDMGMGKTLTALCLWDHLRKTGAAPKLIVVTPFSSVIDEWRNEIKRHFPKLKFSGFDQGKPAAHKQMWDNYEDADVVACTAAMFLRRLGVSKNARNDADEQMLRLVENFDMLVFDESSFLRSNTSQIFNCLDTLADSIPYRYLLTGTPMDGDPMDLWSQFRIIDRGRAFGEKISIFRETYFSQKMVKFGKGRVSVTYEFQKKYLDEIHQRCKHRSIRFEAHEHAEMPEMLGGLGSGKLIVRRAFMSDRNQKQYDSMLKEIREANGDVGVIENAYFRMRQICSGYISVNPKDETCEKFDLFLPDNPKLTLLSDVITQLPLGTKVIIACWYSTTAKMVADHIREKHGDVVKIEGSTKPDDRRAFKEEFCTGSTDFLVGTKAIGYGGNFAEASHIIFFESPDSTIDREQFERRIVRGNSKHARTTCLDLVIAGSVDEWILQRLVSRERITASVIKGIAAHEMDTNND